MASKRPKHMRASDYERLYAADAKKQGKRQDALRDESEKAAPAKAAPAKAVSSKSKSEKAAPAAKPIDEQRALPASTEDRAKAPQDDGSLVEARDVQEESNGAASEQAVNRSAALISALVIVSRLTGFLRTWAQAHALGVTITASCYSVANNLPNQLYELVIGGMLVTAFLPVYLAEKTKGGRKAGNAYASNLTTIVLILMGAISVACIAFAAPIVFTQSFSATEDFDSQLAVYFFRFFAVEVLLYSLSSIFSGVLNAEREYVWSSSAPILNNVVVTASFLAYPGIWTLIATGVIYTVCTNFSYKQRWVRTKWIVTFATALSGVIIASAPLADAIKLCLMALLIIISVCHLPKNKVRQNTV